MNTRSIGWLAIVIAGSSLFAAERTERVVTALLEQEQREAVPLRATVLQPVLVQSPDLTSARWLAGYISSGKEWLPFDQIPARSDGNDALQEYRVRRGTEELKLDDHLELANWCEKHRLPDQARAHLVAVVSEQPQRAEIWKRLGYKLVDGRWMTADEERELEQRWQQRNRDLKKWRPKAANLAKRLSSATGDTATVARQELLEIHDVSASPALEEALTTSTPELALEFIKWAKGIDRVETTLALTRQAIIAPNALVRQQANDSLREHSMLHYVPAMLDSFVSPLESSVYFTGPARIGQPVFVHQFRRELRNSIQISTRTLVLGPPRSVVDQSAFTRDLRDAQNRALANLGLQRTSEDLNRRAEEISRSGAEVADASNELAAGINTRVSMALRAATKQNLVSPSEWQTWWREQHLDIGPQSEKRVVPVVEISEFEVLEPPILVRVHSCLPAGTPVYTELGPQPIESLRLGDRVLSKDVDTGELAYRPILKTTVRKPQPLVKLSSEQETIQSTNGHHFFVSGRGWVMARDLKPGDRFHGIYGTVTLTDVSPGDTSPVYNLVVDRANTYFVGKSLVLSHDVTTPSPTNVKVPGLAAK
jgi:hypothetical protein